MDLLFIELMLHLSHVKKMCRHELILSRQITRRRKVFSRDFSVKIIYWDQVLKLSPSKPATQKLSLCFSPIFHVFKKMSSLGLGVKPRTIWLQIISLQSVIPLRLINTFTYFFVNQFLILCVFNFVSSLNENSILLINKNKTK